MRRKLFPKHPAVPAPQLSEALTEILNDLRSPDAQTRADAVRQLCPCRRPSWEVPVFDHVIALRNDPSPIVRHAVEHDLEENPKWGKRAEARRMEGRRVKGEYAQVKDEIDTAMSSGTSNGLTPLAPHSLALRTRPRRRTHGKHRLSR